MKRRFLDAWQALPGAAALAVQDKLRLLTDDPTPDGKVKVKIKGASGLVCRLRAGDHRILYTYKKPYVSLLDVRLRNEKTYDDVVDAEDLGGLDADVDPDARPERVGPDWEKIFAQPAKVEEPLPEPLTAELLGWLGVAEALHARLVPLKTREALYDVPGVPDEVKLLLDAHLFEGPVEEALAGPELEVREVDDLLRFREGTLVGFLLRLHPEQEKIVTWALDARGPTLVKGGPGTGKSTVALYRVKALLEALPAEPPPRILFTTYTNALVTFSEQLLHQLLGEERARRHVDVRTADSLVWSIVGREVGDLKAASKPARERAVRDAMAGASFPGNALQQAAMKRTIERLGAAYLGEEVDAVIEARGLETLDQYLVADRPGRRVPLNATQRTAVWQVREALRAILQERELRTFRGIRQEAARLVADGKVPRYDAVVVDEAQDLDPIVVRMLVDLCAAPNRLFLTADANQSIYGGGFRWSDVHGPLRFQGRTAILHRNHRTTREVEAAARSYLAGGALEADDEKPVDAAGGYVHSGPIPVVRAVATPRDEAALVARFLAGAARHYRLPPTAGVALVPTEDAGQRLATALADQGLDAEFMSGKELDLQRPVVKVITLKSAKGLEFPVVALAGFVGLGPGWPPVPQDAPPEAADEVLAQERRTLFVAMTRAMRALLVVVPQGTASQLLQGFDGTLWNTGPAPEAPATGKAPKGRRRRA